MPRFVRPKFSRTTAIGTLCVASIALASCDSSNQNSAETKTEQQSAAPAITTAQVATTDADIAFAVYSDALNSAQALKSSVQTLIDTPTQETLSAARLAWRTAREPYGQSEIYRFRLSPVDSLDGLSENGPEPRINAWPLGEAIIDYVASNIDGDSGPEATAPTVAPNIIADIAKVPLINKTSLAELNEQGGDERNVTTGYHAIEFLLWGQDLNQETKAFDGAAQRDASAGQRPFSDYLSIDGECTSGAGVPADTEICKRRGQYLLAITDLLIEDLQSVVAQWNPESGQYYANYVANPDQALAKMIESMGRLSFGELAGERINIALTQDSQEDEHSCFSDNTHRDILLNAKGIQNAFLGSYTRADGSTVSGPSLKALLEARNKTDLATDLTDKLNTTMAAAEVINAKALAGMPFDQQIQQGGINNPEIKAVIAGLVSQTQTIEAVIAALQLKTGDIRQDTEQAL